MQQQPDVRIVMLTMHADQEVLAAAIRAGASGYLVKDCSTEEIASAVRMAASGETALSPQLGGATTTLGDPAQIARVLTEVADSYINFQVVALRELEERASLAVTPEVLATVPFFDTDIYDLNGLLRLGATVWR